MDKIKNFSTTPVTFSVKNAEKKIGNTTYIIITRFNGDKKRSVATSLARIIKRDYLSGNDIPKISA